MYVKDGFGCPKVMFRPGSGLVTNGEPGSRQNAKRKCVQSTHFLPRIGSYWCRIGPDSACCRGSPVFARAGMQFESHLGHSIPPRQRGFCFDVCALTPARVPLTLFLSLAGPPRPMKLCRRRDQGPCWWALRLLGCGVHCRVEAGRPSTARGNRSGHSYCPPVAFAGPKSSR